MIQYNNIPLTAEERHAFTEIVSKGEYVRIGDRNPPIGSTEPDDTNGIARRLAPNPRVKYQYVLT